MAGAKHKVIMNVSLDSLWDVITDYEGYADFVEGVQSIKITKKEGKSTFAEYVVSMFGKKIKYVLKHTESPKKGLKWTMVEGEFFKSNDGSWELSPIDDNKVEAVYTVDVGMPLLVPKAIVNTLTGSQLPSMMKAFEEAALKKAKSGSKGKKKK